MKGKVTLVGAGPGDKRLLTLGGLEAIRNAEAVVYDRLANPDILDFAPGNAELIPVGKENRSHPVPQQEINEMLVKLSEEGRNTVRLKGGDCYLFGRGGEECEYLLENGVPFEVIPGVTSALAAPAYAGIPVTHRDYCSSVHIVTAHARYGKEPEINYKALSELKGTLVFLMGLEALEKVTEGLQTAGMPPETPSAVIENGARGTQRKVLAPVSELSEKTRKANIKSPAIIVVGEVCSLSEKLDWFTPLPLHGKTIAVTRPKERIGTLAEKLRKLGANVIECPCIELHEAENLEPLGAALKGRYDFVAFTSPSGVTAAANGLQKLKLDLRVLYGMKLAAIGQGTAKALSGYGLSTDVIPKQYDGESLAEALIKSMGSGGSVLLLRARQGGKILPERLRGAGINVTDVPIYDTVYGSEKAGYLRRLSEKGGLNYVTFTSASTVEGFVNSVSGMDFKSFTAVCIGGQTAGAAKKYGMEIITAKNATIDDLIGSILDKERRPVWRA